MSALPNLHPNLVRELPDEVSGIAAEVIWPGKGTFPLYIEISDMDDPVVRRNYGELQSRWSEFLPDALQQIEQLRKDYKHNRFPIKTEGAFFQLAIPTEPYADRPEWTFALDEKFGWVVDYEGWEVVGGQGVF